MVALDFPESALSAARQQVIRWGHKLDGDLEDLLFSVSMDLGNELSGFKTAYGVEDAILSDTRLRLLDKVGFEKQMFNCGELGVNLFLIYIALGAEDRVRLLRFNPETETESSHFGLLVYEEGFDKDPTLIDPLWERLGRVGLRGDGFIFSPINWLVFQDPDTKSLVDELTEVDKPKYIKTEMMVLSKEEVIRHVNYINSPLGFFDYFHDGQKIRCEKGKVPLVEYTAKTTGEKLRVQATCSDPLLDLFTFQREYTPLGDEMHQSDRVLLHFGYSWTNPTHILYDSADPENLRKIGNEKKHGTAFIAYAKAAERSKNFYLFSKNTQEKYVASLKNQKENLENAIKDSKAPYTNYIGLIPSKVEERIDDDEEKLKEKDLLLDYIQGMDEKSAGRFLDQSLFKEEFRKRKIKLERPYDFFRRGEVKNFLAEYAETRYKTFAPYIEDFFSSQTTKKLLDQYQKALRIKRDLDSSEIEDLHQIAVNS